MRRKKVEEMSRSFDGKYFAEVQRILTVSVV
jgi:hypothetical protein